MNKKHIIVLLFISHIIINSLSAQSTIIIKADKLYNNFSFIEAIERYESITDKTPDIYRKLAECYRYTGDTKKAEENYANVVNSEERLPEDAYFYATMLQSNGKYEDAKIQMKLFNSLKTDDSRAEKFLNKFSTLNSLQKDKGQFVINNLDINSENDDFGPAFFNNSIVFSSTNSKFESIKREWSWNRLPFLDLYIADVDSVNQLVNVESFGRNINKKYHEGPVSFAKNGQLMAYTRNNYEESAPDKIVRLKIFFKEMKDSVWQELQEFYLNSSGYSVAHPSLTNNGDTMYFVSDMEGGYGGTDIYYVKKDTSGNWGKPVNLGNKVNTEGNEMFPYVHEKGMLFFASDGNFGLGGLDVFYTKFKNNKPTKIYNLGYPINDLKDDFGFIIDRDLKNGYFSSNRTGGKGNDDLYSFKMFKPFGVNIRGKSKDENGNIIANTQVVLFDLKNNAVDTVVTDENGDFSFVIDYDKKYLLTGEKVKYKKDEKSVDSKVESGEIYIDLILKRRLDVLIQWVVKDSISGNTVEDANLIVKNNISEKTDSLKTDSDGKQYLRFEEVKINDSINLAYTVAKTGYMNSSLSYFEQIKSEGERTIIVNLQKIEEGADLGKLIHVNPIYFDLGRYNIRADAAIELDKIVKVMNENPTMVIELGSHTDSRGSASSNMFLSDRRAKASANYIKKRITNPERIIGKGYGESQIINKCTDGVRCSEEEHQQNRRTEFKIIKM